LCLRNIHVNDWIIIQHRYIIIAVWLPDFGRFRFKERHFNLDIIILLDFYINILDWWWLLFICDFNFLVHHRWTRRLWIYQRKHELLVTGMFRCFIERGPEPSWCLKRANIIRGYLILIFKIFNMKRLAELRSPAKDHFNILLLPTVHICCVLSVFIVRKFKNAGLLMLPII
jgi:hypothetical protein